MVTSMSTPRWGEFQKPISQSKELENEYSKEVPGEIADNAQPEGQKPQWGNFQSPMTYQGPVDPTADEGLFESALRGTTRFASRGLEQTFGSLGNLEKFTKDVLTNVPQMGGFLGWAISEYVGPERWEQFIRGSGQQNFPTSSQFKQASEVASKGYTTPKTKREKELDEVVEDIASTFNPLTRAIPGTRFQRAANHFLIPAAANATKKVVNDLGFGEDKANQAKMAVWIPLSLINNVNGSRYASDLMNRGRNGFNQNQMANVPVYQNQLNHIERNMLRGDPRSALAQQQIAGITDDIANGRVTMRDLMTRYDAINAAKRDRGLFTLNAGDRAAAVRNINQVRDVVRNQIEVLGQSNPQALRDWQNGVQAWATIHTSNALTNAFQNLARGPYAKILTGPAAALFGAGTYGAASHPLVSATGAGIAAGGYKTGQVIYRVLNDPNLANYYWNALNALTESNIPVFLSNYEKLNKGLEKSDSIAPKSQSKK